MKPTTLFVDPNNLPEYMAENITDDVNDCGVVICKETGEIGMMEDLKLYLVENKMKIDWDMFKEHYILLTKGF